MDTEKPGIFNWTYIFGIIIFGMSSLLYGYIFFWGKEGEVRTFNCFVWYYGCAISYFVTLLLAGKLKRKQDSLNEIFILLLLLMISAWAFNTSEKLIPQSVRWQQVAITVLSVNLLLFAFMDKLPAGVKLVMCIILGATLVLLSYYVAYLLKFYIFCLLFFWVYGFSLLVFVPLMMLFYVFRLIRRHLWHLKFCRVGILAGLGGALLITMVFALCWRVTLVSMEKQYRQAVKNHHLKAWAAGLPHNGMHEKILRSGWFYSTSSDVNFFAGAPGDEYAEMYPRPVLHDPLIMIAAALGGSGNFTIDERQELLELMYTH